MGRSAQPENLRWSREALAAAGIECVTTTRGGDATYHGPGQLVGYPIINLAERGMGVTDYITAVEEVLITTLKACGLANAGRDSRNRGVWVGNDKIVAIGIKVSRQVTMHGFALNITTRLTDYAGIVPCGLVDAGVTSLERLLGTAPPMARIKELVVEHFAAIFGYDQISFAEQTPAALQPE
jgi:lipoyl(octanoyl) transferase